MSNIETFIERILAILPIHPEILESRDPWKLFDVEEFHCKDLDLTYAQAQLAFDEAIRLHLRRLELIGECRRNILTLIPEHPEILTSQNCLELFDLIGFRREYHSLTISEVRRALDGAKEEYEETAK